MTTNILLPNQPFVSGQVWSPEISTLAFNQVFDDQIEYLGHHPKIKDESLSDDPADIKARLAELQILVNALTGVEEFDPSTIATTPIGSSTIFFGVVDPSPKWLICNGRALSRVTYAALWEALGYPNTGDGATTFNLPNMEGRFPLGSSTAYPFGGIGGSSDTTLSIANLPAHGHDMSHGHNISDPGHTHGIFVNRNDGTGNYVADSNGGGEFISGGAAIVGSATGVSVSPISANTGSTGNGTAFDNMPPYQAVNFIIRVL